jgi:hypothetical protein
MNEYASKCYFIYNGYIEHHERYAGMAISRGHYYLCVTVIKAYFSASYNIIRKSHINPLGYDPCAGCTCEIQASIGY